VIPTFPYIVPQDLTIREAAAPSSQTFMLVGTLVLLPIILAYTAPHVLAAPRQGRRGRGVLLIRTLAHLPAASNAPAGGKRVNAAPAFPPVELGLQAQAPEPGL
jgi:Tfp pilus assembly protein PilN